MLTPTSSIVKPNIVFNTACPITFPYSGTPEYHHRINVEGNTTLIRHAVASPSVAAFIYTSSALIIAAPEYTNATEEEPILQSDPSGQKYYNSTKAVADALTRRANNDLPPDKGGIRTATIRPGSIYGEDDVQLLPSVLGQLDSGSHRFQLGSNTSLYDFNYVGNVADAHILAAEALVRESTSPAPSHKRVSGESFIVTNDDPRHWYDFMNKVWAASGYDVTSIKPWIIPTWAALTLGSVSDWVVWAATLGYKKPQMLSREAVEYLCLNRTHDMSKAKERLGYRTRVSVDEGIERGVKSMMERKMRMEGGKKDA